jgi:hypothetical protein
MTPALNPRLTADDAAFLYLERREMPLHIGSISIFEAPLPFERFVQQIDSKLHLIPRYRQRVVPAPFNIGHPSWEDDAGFDQSADASWIRRATKPRCKLFPDASSAR